MSDLKINISDNIRKKILAKNYKITSSERLEVEVLYLLIAKRKLAKGCSDCLGTAYKVITNYMAYHEPRQKTMPDKKTIVKNVVVSNTDISYDDVNPLFEFTLSELREMYPNIKSTSVKGFIAKIEANEQG
jgi:hypothetical protein